jgi:uncharacterized lipoprotein YajG
MMKKVLLTLLAALASIVLLGCPNPVTDPPKSTNADLSTLTVSSGTLSPDFSAENTMYSVSVANAVTSITVTGTKADSTATVSANNGVAQDLNVGANTITIMVTAQNGTTVKNYVVTVTRAAPISTNADLSALTVSSGTLSPDFSAETTAYSVSVANAVTSITVTGTKADSTATVSANNGVAQDLNVGANTITITVTAQNGTTVKNYVVTVSRAAPISTNADLSTLTVSSGTLSPDFSAENTTYSVSVANAVTSITVTGTKADSTATVSANNGVAQDLIVGANTITITVTAQNGTTVKNYVVTVTRAAPISTNADLSALTVSSGTLSTAFSAETTAYSVSVANAVTSITVTGTKADSTATVSANNGVAQDLIVGANTITITVTAQNGTTVKNYVVTVTRAAVYTLTYHLNGGTGTVPDPQNLPSGASLTHPGQANIQGPLIQDGISQRFLGWKTQADGSGQNAGSSMPASTYNLYAIWTQGTDVLGKIGPAGGIIIYERPSGELIEGYEWRYLEAAPSEGTTEVNWARLNTSVATQISIGSGYVNSQNLESALGADAYANRRARSPTYQNTYLSQTFTDYYLPSLDELLELYKYKSLLNGVATNKYYWSSSQSTYTESNGVKSKAYRIWMGTGTYSDHPKNTSLYSGVVSARVRAIRRF